MLSLILPILLTDNKEQVLVAGRVCVDGVGMVTVVADLPDSRISKSMKAPSSLRFLPF